MKSFKLASISDIHLGHDKTSTADIIDKLNIYFTNDKVFSELNFVCIVGDVFDQLLSFSNQEVDLISLWVSKLIKLCSKYKVILRILEGTPSHDWTQSKLFSTLHNVVGSDVDFKYIELLSVEHIKSLNISVLYIPDEWANTKEQIYNDSLEAIKSKGLTQVDFAFIHGTFNYQLPEKAHTLKHTESDYLSIVKELIFVGHIHKYSNYDRIYAQGSFDRLCHGEESDKGFIIADIISRGNYNIKFIVNELSQKYITIDCTKVSNNDTINFINTKLTKLDTKLKKLNYNYVKYIRLLLNKDNPLNTNIKELSFIHGSNNYIFSKKIKDDDKVEAIVINKVDKNEITITKDNILKLVNNKLTSLNYDESHKNNLLKTLEEFV